MALLKRSKKGLTADGAACTHEIRDPRWDAMVDAGRADRVDHYICRACGARLGPELGPGSDPAADR